VDGDGSIPALRRLTTPADTGVFMTKLYVLSGWGIWGTREESVQESGDSAPPRVGQTLGHTLRSIFFGDTESIGWRHMTYNLWIRRESVNS